MSRVATVVVAALAVGACSLALDFDDECSSDAECEASDPALECASGFCAPKALVQLPSSDPDVVRPCTVLFGADPRTREDPTILIGTVLPKSGQLAAFGPGMERAVELAVEEINQNGGVLGQRIGVLACDSATDPAVAIAAAEHLVHVGRVDAIVGAGASSITIDIFNAVVMDAGALMVSSASTSPAITDLPDEGRLWRTVPSDANQGAAIARYLEDQAYQNVAVVNRDDAYGNGLAGAIRAVFCAERSCTSDNYRNRIYATGDPERQRSEQVAILEGLRDEFSADVLVLIGFLPDGVAFLNAASGAPWDVVLTDGMKDDALLGTHGEAPDAEQPGLDDPNVLCRIVGTNPASPSSSVFQSFASRYNGRFGTDPTTYAANSYDALYAIALAHAAARGADVSEIDGRALAEGLTRLSEGTPVTLGPLDWNKGVNPLSSASDTTIDVDGASGPLDFDPSTGEATSGIEMWRVDLGEGRVVNLPGVVLTPDGAYLPPDVPDACAD